MEKCGCFSARQLVSGGKSHSSGVHGQVVRFLLFNPEVSCSSRCVCANLFTSRAASKQSILAASSSERYRMRSMRMFLLEYAAYFLK